MAAIPIVVLLGAIGFLELKAHVAALLGLAASLAVAIFTFGMPAHMAFLSAASKQQAADIFQSTFDCDKSNL